MISASAISGTVNIAGTNLVFTPNTNFNGTASINYTINDGHSGTASATVSLTVTAVNDAPLANSQDLSLPEDTAEAIVLTGSNVDGNPLTFAITTGPANGVISGFNASTGALIYTPSTNFNGADSFTFQVSDGTTTSAAATVTITVTAISDAPPIIQSIGASGDGVTVTWSAIEGRVYQVQYKSDLSEPTWNPLLGNVTAKAASAAKVDFTASTARRFYRVVMVP